MTERHDARGRSVLGIGVLALVLCVAAAAAPDAWLAKISTLFGGADPAVRTPFSSDVATLDEALTAGRAAAVPADLVPLVAARRMTRAGPMSAEEVHEAARMWRTSSDDDLEARLIARFPRLSADRVRAEIGELRAQLDAVPVDGPPGGGPTADCDSCHRETLLLPEGRTFDLAGIYPFATEVAQLAGGRRVPLLDESIELEARKARGPGEKLTDATCQTCHSAHGAPDFEVGREQRVQNMGLWANVKESDPGVLHVEVKVKNTASGHRAPAGRISPGYVVTVQARQHREALRQRYGARLPQTLQTRDFVAGTVFGRDYRDLQGRPTVDPDEIVDLRADTRLESGRFQQSDFLFDRIDESAARIEVTLWYLPNVLSWKDATPIRRADKPETAH